MRHPLLFCIATTLALATAGCGGGSDAPSVARAAAPLAPESGPPLIVAMPRSRSVRPQNTVQFSVIAGGEPPLRYQWRRNGVPIEGAVSSSYFTPPLTAEDDGAAFDVIVSNNLGSVPSAVVLVHVRLALDSVGPVARLQRLANIVVALVNGGRITQNLFLAGRSAARFPATSNCPASGNVDATVDRLAAVPGAALPMPRGRLDVAYTDCWLESGLFHDGRVELQYDFAAGAPDQLRYAADLDDLNVRIGYPDHDEFTAWDVTLNGRIDVHDEISPAASSGTGATSVATNVVFTPAAGTTVYSRLTQKTARFLAGSYVAQGCGSCPYPVSVEFRHLAFEIEGSTYVVSSSGPFTPATVTRDGLPLGSFQLLPYLSTSEIVPGESSPTEIDWF